MERKKLLIIVLILAVVIVVSAYLLLPAGQGGIDLSQGDGAPYCSMQLGDAGADVIKVEPLEGDWSRHLGPPFDVKGDGPLFMGMNRNKRSIALDLATEKGREVVRRLAAKADVFLESFTTEEEMQRLGFTYEELSRLNPRLIYCDVSCFERSGPRANKPATELTLEGISGLMRFIGERGKEPCSMGYNYAGVVTAMVGLLTALPETRLFKRLEREGRILAHSTGNNLDAVLNFIPKCDRDTLIDGYRRLVKNLYTPKEYYRRIRTFLRDYRPTGPRSHVSRDEVMALLRSLWIMGVMTRGRREFWKFLTRTLLLHRRALGEAANLAITGHHFRKIAAAM